MLFYSILRYFATKARENANLKKEEFLFFSKNKKRKTTKKEEMVTYGVDFFVNLIKITQINDNFWEIIKISHATLGKLLKNVNFLDITCTFSIFYIISRQKRVKKPSKKGNPIFKKKKVKS